MTTNASPSLLPTASGAQVWRELRTSAQGRGLRILLAILTGLSAATLGLVIPTVIGRVVDLVDTGDATTGKILVAAAIMAAAALGGAILGGITTLLAARTYQAILADLRERLITRAMSLPQSVVERAGTGDLIARSSDDVSQIASAAPQVLPAFTRSGFTLLVTFVGITSLDWRYGIALLINLPVYVLIVRWYTRTAPPIYQSQRTAMGHRAQHILESLRGRDTVTGFGLGQRRHQAVTEASWSVVIPSIRARTVLNMFFTRLQFTELVGMAAILLIGFWLIDAGHSTLGAATAAVLLFLRLSEPVNQLLLVADVFQSALASLARIAGVISMPQIDDPHRRDSLPASMHGATDGATSEGHVHIENVTFAYDGTDHPALDQVSLSIGPSERVAVVGASGAGKTTLAGVIAGIHIPQTGNISRPANTVVIAQHPHVFAGTLRENLTLASPGADDDTLIAALKATGAEPLLGILRDGLDTQLGSAGRALTTAQAQQIALARVLLADPDLAIFDEATAEAGSTHAGLLDRAATAALEGRTGLVIAHRLSQAAECDRILVMAGGRIIENGTHTDLIEADGTYAHLWRTWSDQPQ